MRPVKVKSIDEITEEIIKPSVESLKAQRLPIVTQKATVMPYPMHSKTDSSMLDNISSPRSLIFDCKSQGIPYQSPAAKLDRKIPL